MTKKLGYTTLAALMLASSPLMAMTDQEIEARFKQYEARIKALESDLANKPSPVYEQNLDKSTSSSLEKDVAQIKNKIAEDDNRFKVNGFITAAVAVADEKLGTDYQFDDKPNFTGDSKVGLQFLGNIDDKTSATVQLLARSRGRGTYSSTEAWDVNAESAYVAYKADDDLTLRMGKMRVPFYMYSETLDVGYSYPWVRPPVDMYVTVLTSYTGADLLYKFSTGPVNHALQFWGGGADGGAPVPADAVADIALEDVYGINITSSWGDFTTRLAVATMALEGTATVTRYDTQAIAALPFIGAAAGGQTACIAPDGVFAGLCNQWTLAFEIDDTLDYYSAGFQYDNGTAFVTAEAATLYTRVGSLFGNADQHYITGGYRYDTWTPYLTYGHSYDKEGIFQTSRKSRSLGLRKELSSGMSAKFEWNNFYEIENNGGFSTAATIGDHADIYTFAVDAVF